MGGTLAAVSGAVVPPGRAPRGVVCTTWLGGSGAPFFAFVLRTRGGRA